MRFRGPIMNRRKVVVMAGGVAAAAALARPALAAQDASPEASPAASPVAGGPGMPPIPEGAVVVAEGLWNPADLALGEDGTLYIAETDVAGGNGSPDAPPPAATPNADGSLPLGPAPAVPAQISQISPDGKQSVLTTEAGGVGIGVFGGSVYVATGGGSVGSGFGPHPEENTVSAVEIATGKVRKVADLGSYEVKNNPDGLDVNPNLYGLDFDADGQLYVADAGGNTIYKIDPASGEFSLFAVVPNLTDLTGATPTAAEAAKQPGPRQPVPTGVVADEGGNINVSLLGEGWSGPSILSYSPDGTYTEGVSGLAMIVNIALGPDGLLYASQLTTDFSGEMPAPGNVLRIKEDGTIEPVVEGLFFPHGIVFDAEGNLFVSTNSIISTPDAPFGQVLRIDGVAKPA
ncbi:MAG: ScyD/ScyE family protein [Thermomicrobiales bacterium]